MRFRLAIWDDDVVWSMKIPGSCDDLYDGCCDNWLPLMVMDLPPAASPEYKSGPPPPPGNPDDILFLGLILDEEEL